MRNRGFTLVEVMMSIGVMTIGAMAVLGMQQQVIRANIHARQLSIATQIAQNWVERLKMDAMRWNAAEAPAQTKWLQKIGLPNAVGTFISLEQQSYSNGGTTRIVSNSFDYYGDDLDTTSGSPTGLYYCASYRLSWVYTNQRLIRADVRVWWAREGVGNLRADYARCEDDDVALNPDGKNFDRYHLVYLSTVLRAY